jgi:hypothetical protein
VIGVFHLLRLILSKWFILIEIIGKQSFYLVFLPALLCCDTQSQSTVLWNAGAGVGTKDVTLHNFLLFNKIREPPVLRMGLQDVHKREGSILTPCI